jgi:hypothetical protein
MRYKKKLIVIMVLVVVLTIIQYALPAHSKVVSFYNQYVFHPFQSVRNIIFSVVPFSVGDVIYVLGGIGLAYVLVKWIYYGWRFRTHRHELGNSMLQAVIVLGIVYIVFILGYGGNYYKPSLTSYWKLDKSEWRKEGTLEEFDRYLIAQLNDYAPGYREASFRDIDKSARQYYRDYTDSRTRNYGVKAKASVFGYFMQHFGVQGYYNPWTGEAQVNRFLPAFMLPFVVCHEMAHQSGIAAEDDANLLSYAVGTLAPDSVFRYSAYFNLWLYAHARLRMHDTAKARVLRATLNPVTLAHLDTLKKIRQRYDSDISNYSGALYDGYLKLHHQKDGIESYNKVAITAWAWEQQRRKGPIRIP